MPSPEQSRSLFGRCPARTAWAKSVPLMFWPSYHALPIPPLLIHKHGPVLLSSCQTILSDSCSASCPFHNPTSASTTIIPPRRHLSLYSSRNIVSSGLWPTIDTGTATSSCLHTTSSISCKDLHTPYIHHCQSSVQPTNLQLATSSEATTRATP